MKKRISKSEIEIARKSSRILFLISFLLLLLLFLGFGLMYVMDVDIMSYIDIPKKEVEKKEKIIKSGINVNPKPMAVEIDVNDSNVKAFYNTVKISNMDVCIGDYYRDQKEVKANELSINCKFSIASKIYEKKVNKALDGKLYVKESDVKDAYESLFGNDSYEKQDSIPCLYKTTFIYNAGNYFTEKVGTEEGGSLIPYEKIIKVVRIGDKLEVTSVVVYYEKVLGLFCKDSNCESSVETVGMGKEYDDDYLDLYVEHNKDKLYQYTYGFQMDDAGFYKYVGYKRTNE